MKMEKNQEAQILNAAYRCIARDGYANISLRQIAKEAGVAVSQISYHYTNKEGLLLAVVSQAAQKYFTYMQDAMDDGESPDDKGKRFINLFQQALQDDPDLFRVIYDSVGFALWSETFRLKMRDVFTDITSLIIEEVFSKADYAGEASNYSPSTLANMLFGGLFGIAIFAILEPEDQNIRDSLQALDILLCPNPSLGKRGV